jgi:protein-tyrosine phosphatase
MITTRRRWIRRGLLSGLALLACEQAWQHGRDYILADKFAEVVPGKIYRGAWQHPWPMQRLVRNYKFKTVLALAHPPDHPLAVRERALAREMGFRWIHIPIVDERGTRDYDAINEKLEAAAAVLADPDNYPVYFHCHHGINRASMVQIAYRTKYCGWTLEQATEEIRRTFGLVEVNHGPDYRHMQLFYADRVLHLGKPEPQPVPPPAATANSDTAQRPRL